MRNAEHGVRSHLLLFALMGCVAGEGEVAAAPRASSTAGPGGLREGTGGQLRPDETSLDYLMIRR